MRVRSSWKSGVVVSPFTSIRASAPAKLPVEFSVPPMPSMVEAAPPDVPRELIQIVDRCLLKLKDQRWQSAADLLAALEPFLPGRRTLQLQVDHMFDKVRLPRARGSFLVALGLVAAVLLEIGGSFAGPAGLPFRTIAPEIAAACAGMLTGRAMAIAMRWRGAPHVDLHRL